MTAGERQLGLEEAFERIEASILPCLATMLDSLLDATPAGVANVPGLAAELNSMASEVEQLTRAVERTASGMRDSFRSAA